MRHHPPRAGLFVDLRAGLEHLRLGDEPVLRHVRGRVRQQRHLGVAVHVDFFDIIGVFEVVEGLIASQLLVPAELAKGVAHFDKAGKPGVVAQEMGVAVDDELARQGLGAVGRHVGGCRLGEAGVEDVAEYLVHRYERGRHPRCGLEKAAARDALPAREPVAHFLEPGFDLALLFGLRHRQVFVARHDLSRHRRWKRGRLGRQQFA